jgi:hypothetical protein
MSKLRYAPVTDIQRNHFSLLVITLGSGNGTNVLVRAKNYPESCMSSFGYFPGVRLSFAEVSEPSVRSILKGLMKNIPKRRRNLI